MKKNIEWFKQEIAPDLSGYEVKYRYFEQGDFGSLHQVEFNSTKLGGSIDFWGLDWLGVLLCSYDEERELINVLLEPDEELGKEKALLELLNFLES